VERLYARLGVTEHPILKLPTAEQVRALLARPGGDQELIGWLEKRARRIQLAAEDPLGFGFEPAPWKDADRLLQGKNGEEGCGVLAIFGGNRATKSVYAVKRACQTAELFPRSTILVGAESETASVDTVQMVAWSFLGPRYKHLNGKRDAVYRINYSQAGGFTERKLVLPNGSGIYFATYNQNPGDFEGWEFGAPAFTYAEVASKLRAAGDFVPPNIGAVTDESLPLRWLQMLSRRAKFRKAHVLWPFTPVRGITPAVKELVGSSAVTVESRPSELLPRQNVPDCPEGHMPYIRKCVFQNARAIYFFTECNPFGPSPGRTYYDEVKAILQDKSSEMVERVAYGFARDSVARAFPKFGAVNIVKRSQLPAAGTNYHFVDPAGSRNWFMLWVRVAPGPGGPLFYIYRDWPDAQRFGEWATATEREINEDSRRGWDGDPGPAQVGQGFGVTKYKQTILEAEKLALPAALLGDRDKLVEWLRSNGADPYHVELARRARAEELGGLREVVRERFIDPRAGRSEHIAEEGGTCIIDEFAEVQVDAKGFVTGPSMEFTPASGVNQDEGFTAVNELLDWNPEQKLVVGLNQPRLFVCEDCLQVRWMFENFTGRAGEKGAAKDPADLVRYMALAQLEYVEEGVKRGRRGRGF